MQDQCTEKAGQREHHKNGPHEKWRKAGKHHRNYTAYGKEHAGVEPDVAQHDALGRAVIRPQPAERRPGARAMMELGFVCHPLNVIGYRWRSIARRDHAAFFHSAALARRAPSASGFSLTQ